MKTYIIFLFLLFSGLNKFYSQVNSNDEKILLIRCDDIGMTNAVNKAAKELIESGLIFSASVMINCPWYQEAVELLSTNPQIAVGLHLTLNAEWKNYRWGPVASLDKVTSLVDSLGYFFPSRSSLYANNPKTEEVAIELRAQVEKAINSGLNLTYLDYHMGTAVDKPEYRAIVEKIAKEYGLGISRYYKEIDMTSMYSDPIESKYDSIIVRLPQLSNETINLLVCHIGKSNSEMDAMIDQNTFGLKKMSKHREAELKALLRLQRENFFSENNIQLHTYKDLVSKKIMMEPTESDY